MWGPRVILSLPSILIPLSLLSLSLLTPPSWSPDSPSWASPPRPRRCPGVVHHRSCRRRRLHPPKPSSSPHPSPARARRRTAATTHSQVGCAGAAYEADTVGTFGKLWGKPAVFRHDRMPMFRRGRVMAEGDEWARHRCIVAPAFSATNLNDTIRDGGDDIEDARCIDIEKGVVRNAAEIIAKASFSIATAAATVFHKAAGDAVPLHACVSSASRSPASSISAPPTRGVEARPQDRRAPARHHRVAAAAGRRDDDGPVVVAAGRERGERRRREEADGGAGAVVDATDAGDAPRVAGGGAGGGDRLV
uniref:Uncharacterized protein n=1 Tax=Oryza meridionalis TaxID=40149 RepID=A0A0E0DE02_9ORYZ